MEPQAREKVELELWDSWRGWFSRESLFSQRWDRSSHLWEAGEGVSFRLIGVKCQAVYLACNSCLPDRGVPGWPCNQPRPCAVSPLPLQHGPFGES